MVWLYGGGFLQGETFGTNASALVAESVIRGTPVIYVNFNYRVGPFGFPQGAEAEAQGALNLGIKDQVVALQWIKSNIAAFGGDPEKITVFGQSAGSISIALLYLNSGLENIVKSAIMESGFQSTVPMFNASMREPAWASFVNATPECSGTGESDTFSCLRRANLSTLVDSFNSVITSGLQSFPFAPVIDGPGGLIPALPSDLLAQGKFARVPFITGTVLDEGATELLEFFAILDRPDATQLDPSFIATADEIFILYPDDPALGSPFGTGNDTFGLDPEYKRICAITGDLAFQSLRRAWIEVATAVGVPAFGYIFTDPESVVASEPWLGVSHAYEVPYPADDELLDILRNVA
ncbi:hypothetical protein EW026_g7922 [Hermanssonia centrifuga]|uniref:Carboxylic ester hydrolase n=1 Tax=Hermanssonia centrifuga TaxID=98765 RepID=A0A4S4K7Z2_9APHY|nr:hypothetical protein EW026_g7922 [Hermanssonia centrifuga]